MDAALRRAVSEHLRPRGFTGSLPHLRRRSETRIDLLSVQYYNPGGGMFVVEVAACEPTGFTTAWGTHIEPDKVKAQDITMVKSQDVTMPRPRLGSPSFPRGDHWFVFGPTNYEAPNAEALSQSHYDRVASEVLHFIEEQAEPFWRTNPSGS
jgi:Domain of unknown function (DUF4304)